MILYNSIRVHAGIMVRFRFTLINLVMTTILSYGNIVYVGGLPRDFSFFIIAHSYLPHDESDGSNKQQRRQQLHFSEFSVSQSKNVGKSFFAPKVGNE